MINREFWNVVVFQRICIFQMTQKVRSRKMNRKAENNRNSYKATSSSKWNNNADAGVYNMIMSECCLCLRKKSQLLCEHASQSVNGDKKADRTVRRERERGWRAAKVNRFKLNPGCCSEDLGTWGTCSTRWATAPVCPSAAVCCKASLCQIVILIVWEHYEKGPDRDIKYFLSLFFPWSGLCLIKSGWRRSLVLRSPL